MYTFMVGPWLSNTQQHYFRRSSTHTWDTRGGQEVRRWPDEPNTGEAVTRCRGHSPIRPTRWLPLCLPLRSSRPRRFPPSLCNCELKPPSTAAHTHEKKILEQTLQMCLKTTHCIKLKSAVIGPLGHLGAAVICLSFPLSAVSILRTHSGNL